MNKPPPEQVIQQLNKARAKNLISSYFLTSDMRLYIYFTPNTNSEVKLNLQGYFYRKFAADTYLPAPNFPLLRVIF